MSRVVKFIKTEVEYTLLGLENGGNREFLLKNTVYVWKTLGV